MSQIVICIRTQKRSNMEMKMTLIFHFYTTFFSLGKSSFGRLASHDDPNLITVEYLWSMKRILQYGCG
jgi:hypothetical protein